MKNFAIILKHSCEQLNMYYSPRIQFYYHVKNYSNNNIDDKLSHKQLSTIYHHALVSCWGDFISEHQLFSSDYDISRIMIYCYDHLFCDKNIRKAKMTSEQIDILLMFQILEIEKFKIHAVNNIHVSIDNTTDAISKAIGLYSDKPTIMKDMNQILNII